MDRRRPQVAGTPGSLYICKNALISRGGDVERAKKFVSTYSLPAGTLGLYGIKGQLFTFGDGAEPSGMPVGVQYQQLAGPSTPTMIRVLDVRAADGLLLVIAEYDDGNIYQFYDGSRITGWDALADANSSFNAVADLLALKIEANAGVKAKAFSNVVQITAKVAGTAFTLATSTTDNGSSSTPTAVAAAVQANVVGVTEVISTGTVTITGGTSDPTANKVDQVTVDAVNLITSAVAWTSSNSATANALVVAINNNSETSGYTAAAVGAIVTLSAAPGTGATPNGDLVVATVSGSVSATDADMAGGVTAVTAVKQVNKVTISGSSFVAVDLWSITADGTEYKVTGRAAGMGRALFVHKKRGWAAAGSLLRYSVLSDFSDWDTTATPATDAGFINMSSESEGAQLLVGMAAYQSSAAIFSRDNILIYSLNTDATLVSLVEPLEGTGTMAARSIVPYGNNDVFYLDDTGIRSIRTRSGHNAAFVEDVGTLIDTFVQDLMKAADEDTLARAAAIVDRVDGRYMLAIDDTIVVLSRFPSSKITAWSYIEPGFSIDDIVTTQREIYVRSGNTVYLYGGEDGDTYPDADEQVAIVETPFHDAGDPAGIKPLNGVDIACENVWHFEILVDPTDTSKVIDAGYPDETTYHKSPVEIPGETALIALRMTCSAAGAATISSVAIHYEKGKAA